MEIHESKWLTNENEIEEYFEELGADFLDCGQGYYQDEGETFVKINEEYFLVKIEASVLGDKQDRGDRLYYVDTIDRVTYEKITYEKVTEIMNKDIWTSIDRLENEIIKLKEKLI